MGIISTIRRWAGKVYGYLYEKLLATAKKEFKVTPLNSSEVDNVISECARAYAGTPSWIDKDDDITTVNFASMICQEVARLTTLAIGISLEGGARADWMQSKIDECYFQLRHWVEYGCAYGTIALKLDGEGNVSCMIPGNFAATGQENARITAAVFKDEAREGDKYYTRFEYHRFVPLEGEDFEPIGPMTVLAEEREETDEEVEERVYAVTNITYCSTSQDSIGQKVPIESTPWAGMAPEVRINNLDQPLFAIFRMPNANNVDVGSPYGLPIFFNALEELRALDYAYSRNATEIYDSKRTVIIDSDKLFMSGLPVSELENLDARVSQMGLPKFVKAVSSGSTRESLYEEINPTLNTDMRLTGINHLLSQIGYKAGFSNGYFVMDEKTGMMTATQVESDDRRTIQTIKDVRDQFQETLDQLFYAMDVIADLYELAPESPYEVTYDFGDIDYNLEEDRARWWQYVTAQKVPAWMYFVKFEGMTEEEAKAMVEEATPEQPELFGGPGML